MQSRVERYYTEVERTTDTLATSPWCRLARVNRRFRAWKMGEKRSARNPVLLVGGHQRDPRTSTT
jgi:hypothetical protein